MSAFGRGHYFGVPGDRERFATCTETDCVAYLDRDRIMKLCDDGNVREISRMPAT